MVARVVINEVNPRLLDHLTGKATDFPAIADLLLGKAHSSHGELTACTTK